MQEQVASLFEFSYKYAWCVLLYFHNQLRLNSCRILLHSVGGCHNVSMFIIICLACSKFVAGCVMLFLGKAGL